MSEPLKATIGWSKSPDATRAGREAAEAALEAITPRMPKLGLVFGSSWLDQAALLQSVHATLGTVPLAGASTAGEIVAAGPMSHSVVVALLAGEQLACSMGLGQEVDRDPREAGQQAGHTALQRFPQAPRAGCLVFGDGLVTSAADVIRGLQESLGTSSLIAGGMAGDDLRFAKTYQYCQDQALSRSIVAVLLGGSLKMGFGIEHGFAPISKPRRITRAHGNRLYELDTQPAAQVYEEYFGTDTLRRLRQEGFSRQTTAYPLGIQREAENHWLLRNVVGFEADGSLACSGDIQEGAWLQLMIGSRELALDAARHAAQQALRPLNRAACVLVFDSAARRMLLGVQQAAAEIARIREVIGPNTPLAGCYTYGEQAPVQSGEAHLRTAIQTGSVLVIALGT